MRVNLRAARQPTPATMNQTPLLLRNARALLAEAGPAQATDIAIDGAGRIRQLGVSLPSAPGSRVIDLHGKLVTPGLVDAHQHLDKSRTREAVPNPSGTLLGAIEAYKRHASITTHGDVQARAEQTMRRCIERGTVAIRTHANIDAEIGLRSIEALVEVRERWRDRIHLQIVALVSAGIANGKSARERLDAAMRAGADIAGGAVAVAADPRAFIDEIFSVAQRHGRPIDLHLDEHLDRDRHHFDQVIDRTRADGMQGKVIIGHACALAALPADAARRICDGLAAAQIGAVTLPAANLFLQGRGAPLLAPRGLTRVTELRAAGVAVACGSDNIQDPFVPTGSGDMLEIARWTFLAAHLHSRELAHAFAMASSIPAQLIGLTDYGLREGARADLLITDAEDAADLVASGPLQRTVLFGGRCLAGQLGATGDAGDSVRA